MIEPEEAPPPYPIGGGTPQVTDFLVALEAELLAQGPNGKGKTGFGQIVGKI